MRGRRVQQLILATAAAALLTMPALVVPSAGAAPEEPRTTTVPSPSSSTPSPAPAPEPVAPPHRAPDTSGSYGGDPVQQFDLYLPSVRLFGGTPLIVWMHGGGWVSGDRSQLSPLILRQLEHGYAVAAVDYHLIPQGGTFPVPIVDTKLAIRYFKANADRWHLRADKVFVGGFSAGGYNASFAALSGPGFYEPSDVPDALAEVDSSVAGVINEAGPTDFKQFGSQGIVVWFDTAVVTTRFLDCPTRSVASCDPAKLQASRVVPLIGPASPPMFLVYGGVDPLVPLANGDVIRAAYQGLGAPVTVDVDIVRGVSHTPALDDGIDLGAFDAWLRSIVS